MSKRTLQFGLVSALSILSAATLVQAAAFTAGNLAVVQVGDGTEDLTTGNASHTYIDEYTPAGVLVQQIALPSSGSSALTLGGIADHDGLLNLSTDGHFLVLAGYRKDAGGTSPGSDLASVTPRVVGRIAADGTVNTTTALTDAYDGDSVRAVASVDGSSFWMTGNNKGTVNTGGARYATLGATTSTPLTNNQISGGTLEPDLRGVSIWGGQLYSGSGSTATNKGPVIVGSGLPTSGSNALTKPTSGTHSTTSLFFADLDGTPGYDTVYTTDTTLGGVAKWSMTTPTSWTARGGVVGGGGDNEGITGVVNGSTVTLYISTALGVYTLTDTAGAGANMSASYSLLFGAPSGTQFRGLAFAPTAVPEPATLGLLALGGAVLMGRRARRRD